MFNDVENSTEPSTTVQTCMKDDRKVDGWIHDLVGALIDPIICWPGLEDDKPPEYLCNAIHLQRLLENMAAMKEDRHPMGTDAEVAWYISTRTLSDMVSDNWVRVYRYCFTKTMQMINKEVPDSLGIRLDELDDYDMNYHLLPLKRWLYKVRSERRKGIERAERKELKEQAKQEKTAAQNSMFEF